MVAAAASSAFFPLISPSPSKASMMLGGAENLDARGVKPRSNRSGGLQVKANAATPKINGTKVGFTSPVESSRDEDAVASPSAPAKRTFINQLPDWSMFLAAITTIFLAAEKQWTNLDWKPRRPDMLVDFDPFSLGRIVQDGLIFKQNFAIRSYEIGADRTASIESLMNHLQNGKSSFPSRSTCCNSTPQDVSQMQQSYVNCASQMLPRFVYVELRCMNFLPYLDVLASSSTWLWDAPETALNHVRNSGLMGDGCFGTTLEMNKRDLIWVVTRMQVLVDRNPSWGDTVEIVTWVAASGKNGMRRDWLIRDSRTGETLSRATSNWVTMNKRTRKLSKLPEEVRMELEPFFMENDPILEEDSRKLMKLDDSSAGFIQKGLSPRWKDLDMNQHVNNVKYVGWLLEVAITLNVMLIALLFDLLAIDSILVLQSIPPSFLDTYELRSMTLEYRKECGRDSVLKSLTAVSGDSGGGLPQDVVECNHLLQLEEGPEVVRGRTTWRPKGANNHHQGTVGPTPAVDA
ncbi:hypothetical protein ACLOJK_019948 [Asimina triloba]